jgi:hypothetical protein
MICASEATDEAFLEEIESSAKVRAEMQEAIILINGALTTGEQTLVKLNLGRRTNISFPSKDQRQIVLV